MKDITNDAKKDTAVIPVEDQKNLVLANSLVNKYTMWSMGAGLIPIPLADLAAVTGIQMKMLSELATVYKTQFSENAAKSIIAGLVGGISTGYIAQRYAMSFMKSVPVIGLLGTSVYSGAITWAIGKVFVRHFETGGTFLTFDVEKTKAYFVDLYKQGKKVAVDLKSDLKATPAQAV
ncbi:MAG: DUF697 domain-containing protein [Ignavibacteriae bacterium]|nr:MAG: DUF697 domain-containing protein [Ignavibacteriota bacterium]